jgi:subtilisin family serine protease
MLDSYWHLDVPDQVAELLRADAVHELGYLGTGVRLTMVDSGWERHPYFVARGIEGTVVLGPGATDRTVDENGHGTGESANAFAVAPEITFTMVKANFANSVGAFNAAVALSPAPHVISNSWGYSVERRPLSAIHQALAASVAFAVSNGIVVVFSAGNGHYGFPAQHPDVIAAGGVFIDPHGVMHASDYASGFASKVYPGRNVPDLCGLVGMRPRAMYIALPVPSGSELDVDLSNDDAPYPDGDGTTPDDGWAVFSGTSAACPQVAGICALIRQVAPDLSPAAVRDVLMRTATDVTEGRASPSTGAPAAGPGVDLATGAGFADAAAAVNAVRRDPEQTIDLRKGSELGTDQDRRVPHDR